MTVISLNLLGNNLKQKIGTAVFWLLLALALLQPLQYLRLTFLEFSAGDEGLLLAGAMRLMHGQVPYRDFFFFPPPGPLYLIAGWLQIFGSTLVAARCLAWAINALLILGLAFMGWTLKLSRASMTLVFLVQVALGFYVWPVVSHHWMANALLIQSAACLLASERGGRWKWLLAAGALAGCCGLMLQDQGGYWVLLVILLLMLTGGERRWAKIGVFVLGGGIAAGPLAAYLLAKMPASRILDEILWIPLRLYHNIPVNRVPWGYGWLSHFERVPLLWSSGEVWLAASLMGKGIGLVVAFLAFPVAGVLVIFRIVRFRRLSMEERWRWQVALSMTGALILMALHKPVSLILLFALPGPLLLILWEWERFRVFRPRLADWLVGMCLALPLTLTAVVSSLPQPYLAPRSSFEFNAGVLTTEENPGKPLWDLLHRFQTSAYRPGQSVFCYRYCSFYSFVLGIPGATGYDNFDVGCLDPAMVNDLLTQLAAKPPNWILLDGTYGRDDPVVAWIKARYHPLEMCRGLFIVGRADTAAKPPVPPELP